MTDERKKNKPVNAAPLAMLGLLIEGARQVLKIKIDRLEDRYVAKQLVAAARRGVRVEIYLSEDITLQGESLGAVRYLDERGVRVVVDRGDHINGGVAMADDQVLLTPQGSAVIASSDPSAVKMLSDAFQAALAEGFRPEELEKTAGP